MWSCQVGKDKGHAAVVGNTFKSFCRGMALQEWYNLGGVDRIKIKIA